jgi:septum formation protein
VKTNIVLASSSPRRIDLLHSIGLEFVIVPSNVEEEILPNESPGQLVERLALSKARDVALSLSPDVSGNDTIVIGADTVVVLDGRILGKPHSNDEAHRMLRGLSGRTHEVYSGVALVDVSNARERVAHEVTKVTMRDLSDDEISAYVSSGEPEDKAGAYAVQGKGALLITSIDGCFYNVVGLPLTKLCLELRRMGIDVFRYW